MPYNGITISRVHMQAMIQQSDISPNVQTMLWRAALIQGMAMLVAGLIAWALDLSLGVWVILTVLFAALMTRQSDLPGWWLLIQILFLPALLMVYSLALPPWIFLLMFVVLFAMYGNVFLNRVPLYISGLATCQALEKRMPLEKNFYFLDLGSGTGSVLQYLDQRFAFGMFHGVETSLLPFVISWVRSKLGKAQFQVMYKNMWQVDLSRYDVVYAFLSPQPMTEIWQKVQREMQPDSIFISNSFAVPDVEPDEIIEINSGRATALYIWRIKEKNSEAV